MDRYKEAIEAIKSNYPPENYTILREGLDLAIEVLEKQIPKKLEGLQITEDVRIGAGIFKRGTKIYKCDCGMFVGRKDNYCSNCGLKLEYD